MFYKCRIAVSNGTKTVNIVLLQPSGYIEQDGVTFYGDYLFDDGNIPSERRGWWLGVASRELRLGDKGGPDTGMGGGGLNYHELASIPPFAFLSQAVLTDRGIEPVVRKSTPSGELKSGFALGVGFSSGSISWCLSGYRIAGTNAWMTP